jgi:hypothetical protein
VVEVAHGGRSLGTPHLRLRVGNTVEETGVQFTGPVPTEVDIHMVSTPPPMTFPAGRSHMALGRSPLVIIEEDKNF